MSVFAPKKLEIRVTRDQRDALASLNEKTYPQMRQTIEDLDVLIKLHDMGVDIKVGKGSADDRTWTLATKRLVNAFFPLTKESKAVLERFLLCVRAGLIAKPVVVDEEPQENKVLSNLVKAMIASLPDDDEKLYE
jgi:hypothetical protein